MKKMSKEGTAWTKPSNLPKKLSKGSQRAHTPLNVLWKGQLLNLKGKCVEASPVAGIQQTKTNSH